LDWHGRWAILMQMFRERAASMQSRPTPRPCQFCVSIFCGARAMSGMTFQGTAQDAVKRLERGIPRHQLHAYLNVFNRFDGHFMGTMANVSCKGRSEERRVGKEKSAQGSQNDQKKQAM